jgi:hypothetical protein
VLGFLVGAVDGLRLPLVGVLCSYYELESAEYAAKGLHLSVEAWLVKLMVGAIDPGEQQPEAVCMLPSRPGCLALPV